MIYLWFMQPELAESIAVIPARYESRRLPGKVLMDIGGKTLLQRTVEEVGKCNSVQVVVVASPDEVVLNHAKAICVPAIRTSAEHICGTDRCGEVLDFFPKVQHIINVQADQPLIPAGALDMVIEQLTAGPRDRVCSVMTSIKSSLELNNRNDVKVIVDHDLRAQGFYRVIEADVEEGCQVFHHIGIYGFPRNILKRIIDLPTTEKEMSQQLEQLRWMEAGIPIDMIRVTGSSLSINSPEDIERAKEIFGISTLKLDK
jgi:3-deoxy-manno-octulosonate cytidylyltransferase (CMP-KDO synthetase)